MVTMLAYLRIIMDKTSDATPKSSCAASAT